MSESAIPTRITATPAAREAISRLRAARGGPLTFVQSGRRLPGSTPPVTDRHFGVDRGGDVLSCRR